MLFCISSLPSRKYFLHLDTDSLRTFTVVTLVFFSGQAVFYIARERQHLWNSPPGPWVIVSSVVDLAIISSLAVSGVLMTALPFIMIAKLFLAAIVFAFLLDFLKLFLFKRLAIA